MFPKILGIDAYLVLAIVGFAAGLLLGVARRKKYGYGTRDIAAMFCAIVGGLIIGARLLFTITEIPAIINNKFSAEIIEQRVLNAGFVFYGGVLGALLAIYLLSKYMKADTRKMLNFVVPTFSFFHAFGRIGCLLQGCCYGVESNWGVTLFGETVKRIPVQLFEAIGLFFITAILLLLESDAMGKGKTIALTPIYLGLYAPLRFMLELVRGDILRGVFTINVNYATTDGKFDTVFKLSTSQIISIIIMIVLMIYVWHGFAVAKREKRAASAADDTAVAEESESSENADE